MIEREARLQQMSVFQHDRLASKTMREREVRLQSCRDRLRQLQVVQSWLPLFEQHSVRTNVLGFHADMASLDSAQCTTCLESCHGVRHSQPTECLRCSQDKHILKLYSAAIQ